MALQPQSLFDHASVHSPRGEWAEGLREQRAYFFGALIGTLAYGALLMLSMQLFQAFLVRPKRGRAFWALIFYTWFLFALASLAIGALWKYCDLLFIDNRKFPGNPGDFRKAYYSTNFIKTIGIVSATVFPWIADILMFSRIFTLSNRKWWLLILPALIHLAKTGISIPLLVSKTMTHTALRKHAAAYGTAYYSLTVAFNLYTTLFICYLIQSMRKRLEVVSGRLQASFYTSSTAMFVESGGFFTMWATTLLILRARGSPFQDILSTSTIYALGITRMVIVLRMAQDRAWTKELVLATSYGVLDWKVASTQSIPLHESMSRLADSSKTRAGSDYSIPASTP